MQNISLCGNVVDMKKASPKPVTEVRKTPAKKRDNTVHVALPVDVIKALDKLAQENSISRSALVAIAVSRTLKSGL